MKSPRYRAILKANGIRAIRNGRNSVGIKCKEGSGGIMEMQGEKIYLSDLLNCFDTPVHKLVSPWNELKNMHGSNCNQ